jgi:Fic family protein
MNAKIISLIAEIDEFKGFWRGSKLLSQERLNTLRILATIESIGSSTRIEGSLLSDSQVSALLQGLDVQSFRSRDDQEVAGYAKAMELIHESNMEIDISESNIKYLHKVIMHYSDKDRRHRGEYKKHPNHVAAFDAAGKQVGIIFETATPFDTPRLMEQLVSKTGRLFAEGEVHPLITIADFVLRFLAIHPFQDGNGRLSRVLTNLMLLRHGYEFVKYSSHERIIEANKEAYYSTLRRSQNEIQALESIQESWTEFFLILLKMQKDELNIKMTRERLALETPEISVRILELTQQHGRITIDFITRNLDVNRNTIKKHLQSLVKQGRLIQNGKARGTFYTIP